MSDEIPWNYKYYDNLNHNPISEFNFSMDERNDEIDKQEIKPYYISNELDYRTNDFFVWYY